MTRFSFSSLLTVVSVGLAVVATSQESLQGPRRVGDNLTWRDCGPSLPVQITSIEVFPDPPRPGTNVTVTVIGQTDELIEDGAYADVVVRVGRIQVIHREFDLCEEARDSHVDIECPVKEGEHTIVHTVELPKEIPKARFDVTVRGYTVDDDPLVCLGLTIDFRS